MSLEASASEHSSLKEFRNMNSLRSVCLFLALPACAFAQVTLASSGASNLPSAAVPQTQSQSTGASATPMGQQATVPQNPPGAPTAVAASNLPSAPVPQPQSQSTGASATPMGQQATVPQNPPGTPTALSLK